MIVRHAIPALVGHPDSLVQAPPRMTFDAWLNDGAVALAAFAAGFTGFGFNLVAVPLLVIALGPRQAVTVALLLGLLTSGVLAATALRRGEIAAPVLALLVLGSLPGLVLGTLSFGLLSARGLRIIIAAVSIAGAAVLMVGGRLGRRDLGPAQAGVAGLLGGFFSATTGTGGPPVVTYLLMTSERLGVNRVRGTILAQGTIVALLAVVAHVAEGQVSPHTWGEALRLAPIALVGLALGGALFRRTSDLVYSRVSNLTLLGIGLSGLLLLR